MFKKKELIGLLTVVFLFGCATKIPIGEKCIENCKKPGWVDNSKEKCTKEVKAFVGRSYKLSTDRQALDYAKTNAWEEALGSMWGTYGQQKIREVCANAGVSVEGIISDAVVREAMTEWKTKGLLQGDFVENHIERWQKVDATGVPENYYVAYRLFIVSRDMVKNFLKDALLREKAQEKAEQTQKNIEKALEALDRMQTKDFEDW